MFSRAVRILGSLLGSRAPRAFGMIVFDFWRATLDLGDSL
jgi:hypothetical protein